MHFSAAVEKEYGMYFLAVQIEGTADDMDLSDFLTCDCRQKFQRYSWIAKSLFQHPNNLKIIEDIDGMEARAMKSGILYLDDDPLCSSQTEKGPLMARAASE